MTASNAEYISPRDKAISDILREMRGMSMPDLASLLDHAKRLNAIRVEHDHLLQQHYPLTPEATENHAE